MYWVGLSMAISASFTFYCSFLLRLFSSYSPTALKYSATPIPSFSTYVTCSARVLLSNAISVLLPSFTDSYSSFSRKFGSPKTADLKSSSSESLCRDSRSSRCRMVGRTAW